MRLFFLVSVFKSQFESFASDFEIRAFDNHRYLINQAQKRCNISPDYSDPD